MIDPSHRWSGDFWMNSDQYGDELDHFIQGNTLCIHSVYAKPNLRQIVFDSAQRKADAVRARFG